MPGHDFEHKVQQKMEELRLTPSRAVWDGVEAEINRDKKRRRLVFILPLLVLLLGSGAFWWASQESSSNLITEKNQKENDSKITHGAATTDPVSKSSDAGQDPGKPNNLGAEKDATQQKDIALPATPSKNTESATDVELAEPFSKPATANEKGLLTKSVKEKAKGKLPLAYKRKKEVFVHTKGHSSQVLKKNDGLQPGASGASEVVNDVSADLETNYEASMPAPVGYALVFDGTDSLVESPILVTVTSPGKNSSRKKSNWQWGITGTVGISKNVQGGFFNAFEKSLVAQDAIGAGSRITQTPYGFASRQPATIQAGYNYSAGVFVQRKLTKKLELSAGLQYNYFSTQNEVGTKVDANAFNSTASPINALTGTYYLDGKGQQHVNAYHFVELPLTLRIKLNNNRQIPVYWSNGLSLAYMVNTSALHYESRFGYYYKNNNLFQKTQWGVHTGLSVRLFNGTNHPLELGPHVNFQFSNLLKSANPDTRHLLGGGLMLRWYMRD